MVQHAYSCTLHALLSNLFNCSNCLAQTLKGHATRGMSEPEAALIGAASPASEGGTAPTRRGGCGLDLGSVHRFCEARDCWLLWRQSMHTAERQAVHVHRWHGTRPGLEPTSSGSIPVRVSTPFGLAHEACTPPATEAASERLELCACAPSSASERARGAHPLVSQRHI